MAGNFQTYTGITFTLPYPYVFYLRFRCSLASIPICVYVSIQYYTYTRKSLPCLLRHRALERRCSPHKQLARSVLTMAQVTTHGVVLKVWDPLALAVENKIRKRLVHWCPLQILVYVQYVCVKIILNDRFSSCGRRSLGIRYPVWLRSLGIFLNGITAATLAEVCSSRWTLQRGWGLLLVGLNVGFAPGTF